MITEARKKASWLRARLTDYSTIELEDAARDAAYELERLSDYLEKIERWKEEASILCAYKRKNNV